VLLVYQDVGHCVCVEQSPAGQPSSVLPPRQRHSLRSEGGTPISACIPPSLAWLHATSATSESHSPDGQALSASKGRDEGGVSTSYQPLPRKAMSPEDVPARSASVSEATKRIVDAADRVGAWMQVRRDQRVPCTFYVYVHRLFEQHTTELFERQRCVPLNCVGCFPPPSVRCRGISGEPQAAAADGHRRH
jgi:hypothetical protein